MNSKKERTTVDDATERLVRSLVRDDAAAALPLAHCIVESSLGTTAGRNHDDMSATWRRIERSSSAASNVSRRQDVEELHGKLNQHAPNDLADRVVTVLSKLTDRDADVPLPKRTARIKAHASHARTDQQNSDDMDEDPLYDKQQLLSAVQAEEALLLRECLYALQGLEGERIQFWEGSRDPAEPNDDRNNMATYEGIRIQPSDVFSLVDPDISSQSRLGSGAMDALRICGEAGWLYRRVQSYVDRIQRGGSDFLQKDAIPPQGVVSRALAAALSIELRDYQALVATLESSLQESSSSLSLRQLVVNLRLPTGRLRTLAMVTDGVSSLSGGPLLSSLHKHTVHGDTCHASLVQSMVYAASQPWFDILFVWTTEGVLSDPHAEFFITEHPHVDDEHMWRDRYRVDHNQVPLGILDKNLVIPSLIVGKGIYFIRKCLFDMEWSLELDEKQKINEKETALNAAELKTRLGYHYAPVAQRRTFRDPNLSRYVSPLHRTLAHAAHQVHTHILRSLQEQHHLIQHLWALKQFLFLGQGDFVSALMDGLHAEFDCRKGIIGIYTHTLMAVLDGALRSTNAMALPPYVLERLRVELMLDEHDDARYRFGPDRARNKESEQEVDRRTGWDVFMLTYDISAPLTAIVHPAAMSQYKLVFSLLFRLKRVEYMLNATWRQSSALQHALQTSAQHNGIDLSTDPGYARATVLLRKISMARQSMLHFVGNLQSYLMFEVLEGGWKDLVGKIKAARTLDEVIHAHNKYLEDAVRKCLLRGTTRSTSMEQDRNENGLATQLEVLLNIARTCCTLQEKIFSDALNQVERATRKRREAERRMKEGQWGFDTEGDAWEEETFYGLTDSAKLQKVVDVSEDFNCGIRDLLSGLHEKVNGSGALPDFESPPATPTSAGAYQDSYSAGQRGQKMGNSGADELRFLTFQLDYSGYYSERGTSGTNNNDSMIGLC